MLNKLGTTEDMVIYHENGNKSYEFKTDIDGLIEKTFDKNGKVLAYKNSRGFSCFYTRDEQGKELAYKNSNGDYEIKDKKVYQEEYEAFIQSLEKQTTMLNKLGTTEDMIEYHENGNKSYEFKTHLYGHITEITFDEQCNVLTYNNLTGYTSSYTRDEKGNELAYENSNGSYKVKDKQVTQEEYEAFIQSLGKKTTMQELIDEIRQEIIKSAQGKNLTNRTGEYRIGLTKAIELATEKLEKEKEQIIEARLDGFKISGEGWNGEYPFEGESCKEINTRIDNEGYYNQTYNQKKQTTMKNKLGTTEDMTEYHENGNIAYEFKTSSNGLIKELTCDKNGYTLIAKNSNGCSYEYTRDDEGNELAFKNSDPYYRIKDKDATQQEYEAFIQSLGKQTTMLNKLGTTEDMTEYHPNGKKSYDFRTHVTGFITEETCDKNGNILTHKDSNGSTSLFTRDEQGKKLAYKDSNGYYEIKRKKVTQQEYEAFIQELEKPKTVVELPSDEEIDKEAFRVPYDGSDDFYDRSFINGAKWMKERILNKNK